jgi:hypothetical protein
MECATNTGVVSHNTCLLSHLMYFLKIVASVAAGGLLYGPSASASLNSILHPRSDSTGCAKTSPASFNQMGYCFILQHDDVYCV